MASRGDVSGRLSSSEAGEVEGVAGRKPLRISGRLAPGGKRSVEVPVGQKLHGRLEAEFMGNPFPIEAAHLGQPGSVARKLRDRGSERGRILWCNQAASLAVDHCLRIPTHGGGYDGQTTCHGLEKRDGKALLAGGEHKQISSCQKAPW